MANITEDQVLAAKTKYDWLNLFAVRNPFQPGIDAEVDQAWKDYKKLSDKFDEQTAIEISFEIQDQTDHVEFPCGEFAY